LIIISQEKLLEGLSVTELMIPINWINNFEREKSR